MKTDYIYYQYSLALFEGFYESTLFNSDTEYNLSYGEDHPVEIKDFADFCKCVAERATSLLDPDNEYLSDFTLLSINSPKYYNFRTDRLVISCKADIPKLREFALIQNRAKFDSYLRENFTSYDGFISFVPNTANKFEDSLNTLPPLDTNVETNLYDVLIEFYLLETTDLESYQEELGDCALEEAYLHAEPLDNESDL